MMPTLQKREFGFQCHILYFSLPSLRLTYYYSIFVHSLWFSHYKAGAGSMRLAPIRLTRLMVNVKTFHHLRFMAFITVNLSYDFFGMHVMAHNALSDSSMFWNLHPPQLAEGSYPTHAQP